MIKNIGFILLLLLTPLKSYAYEYVIFKSVLEDLEIEQLPHKFTVWHIDALNLVKYRGEAAAVSIAPEKRVEYMTEFVKSYSPEVLEALFVMGWSGREKMKRYGLTKTPAAVLLDDEGNVVRVWDGIEDGSVLYMSEGRR